MSLFSFIRHLFSGHNVNGQCRWRRRSHIESRSFRIESLETRSLLSIYSFLRFGLNADGGNNAASEWIEIESYSFGATNSGRQSQERRPETATSNDLNLAKARPRLLPCVDTQTQSYIPYELEDVVISSVQPSFPGNGELPTESISLNFSTIRFN